MTARETPSISSRKAPKQARATALIATILEAATQVLAQQGAARFTTARVAERAGVSIGSLYQYFPSKAAILFRLQRDEWRENGTLLRMILEDCGVAPPDRLRRLVHAFLRSECAEARLRIALGDAAPLYRDAPEARAAHADSEGILVAFLAEARPHLAGPVRELAGELMATTLSQVGKRFSERPRGEPEIVAYADAMADMLCAYLDRLASGERK